jgi:hypothetical protein
MIQQTSKPKAGVITIYRWHHNNLTRSPLNTVITTVPYSSTLHKSSCLKRFDADESDENSNGIPRGYHQARMEKDEVEEKT